MRLLFFILEIVFSKASKTFFISQKAVRFIYQLWVIIAVAYVARRAVPCRDYRVTVSAEAD